MKNASRVHYNIYNRQSVREIPEYAQPATEEPQERTSLDLPCTAEVPYVEPTAHDRLRAARAAEEAALQAQIRARLERAAITRVDPPSEPRQPTASVRPDGTAYIGTAAPGCPGPQLPRRSAVENSTTRKPPTNVKPTPPKKANGATAG